MRRGEADGRALRRVRLVGCDDRLQTSDVLAMDVLAIDRSVRVGGYGCAAEAEAVDSGVAGLPASRSFQFRIALNPRKNRPCVCQRQ